MKLRDLITESKPKKGDYVEQSWTKEIGLINKAAKGYVYVKYPSTDEKSFEPVYTRDMKKTNILYKGKTLWTDG